MALKISKAKDLADVLSDPAKEAKYYEVLHWPMAGYDKPHIKGIEEEITMSQYRTDEHRNAVVDDILDRYEKVSHGRKFHSIFATSGIPEAIEYYKLLKSKEPDKQLDMFIVVNQMLTGFDSKWINVAKRLGHSSMNTTEKTYLHIIQKLENKDVDLVMRSLSVLC